MRTEGDNQLRRARVQPQAEVDVIPPDHPSEEEMEALARPPASGGGEEMAHPRGEAPLPVDGPRIEEEEPVHKGGEGGTGVLVAITVAREEAGPEGAGG